MKGSFLPPWVLQMFGLLIIAVFVVVKIQTGEESIPLVGVGVSLATLGGLSDVAQRIKRTYYKGQQGERLPGDKDDKQP